MMKQTIQKTISYMAGVFLVSMFLMGCSVLGPDGGGAETESTQEESANETETGLFLIMEHDTIEETLLLYSYETGLEYYYQYHFSTKFLNKYGDHYPAVRFTPGKVITMEKRDEFGYLTTVRMSDEVWEQEKVKRFSIDEEHGVFTISNTNYSIQGKVVVFSNEKVVPISDLTKNDTLSVVGLGNKILSINVTTGHGILALTNTELFDGSLLKLNDDMFAEISPDMTMEIPEGTYTLTVANDGWGSSREITITRGETTEVDLDSMKGEGKKKGMISFRIDAEDVAVYIDYEKVDHTQPVEVTYGTHRLEVKASGYADWKKYLVVNSEEVTLIIELEEESEDKDSESDKESESEKESEKESKEDSEESKKDSEKDSGEQEGSQKDSESMNS